MSESASESSPVAVAHAPISQSQCFENAARVLRFAEGETNPVQFDQYMTLAERWMELGASAGES